MMRTIHFLYFSFIRNKNYKFSGYKKLLTYNVDKKVNNAFRILLEQHSLNVKEGNF